MHRGKAVPVVRPNDFTISTLLFKEAQMNQETSEWQAVIRKANQLFRATLHPVRWVLWTRPRDEID